MDDLSDLASLSVAENAFDPASHDASAAHADPDGRLLRLPIGGPAVLAASKEVNPRLQPIVSAIGQFIRTAGPC